MEIEFKARLKKVAFEEEKDDADPDEPEVVITLRAQLAPHKIGQLARFSGRSMTVAMSSAQLGFDTQQGNDGRPSLVPERRGTNG